MLQSISCCPWFAAQSDGCAGILIRFGVKAVCGLSEVKMRATFALLCVASVPTGCRSGPGSEVKNAAVSEEERLVSELGLTRHDFDGCGVLLKRVDGGCQVNFATGSRITTDGGLFHPDVADGAAYFACPETGVVCGRTVSCDCAL